MVWGKAGSVRNPLPSRGQAASARRRRKWGKRRRSLPFEMTDGCYGWEVSTQQAPTVILNAVPVAFSTDRQSVYQPPIIGSHVAHGNGLERLQAIDQFNQNSRARPSLRRQV